MQGVLFPSRGVVKCTDLPDPRPGSGEVVVEVRAGGICHTDIEVLRGNYGTGAFPVVACHEFAGEIIELGPDVEAFEVGDRVVVDPNIECGRCRACLRGWAHLCGNLGAYGVTVNGGFAERCAVTATACHGIGDMPWDLAALAEPMGCVLNGVEEARSDRAESAMIFGAGPMGLMMAMALRVRGVTDVALVDLDEARLALAEDLGFTALHAGSDPVAERKRAMDLVVEATGVAAVAESALSHVADGGTLHLFGVAPQAALISLSPFEIFRRQLSIVGSHSLNHNIPEALDAVRNVGSTLATLVTHRTDLEGIAAALSEGLPDGAMKVQFAV